MKLEEMDVENRTQSNTESDGEGGVLVEQLPSK